MQKIFFFCLKHVFRSYFPEHKVYTAREYFLWSHVKNLLLFWKIDFRSYFFNINFKWKGRYFVIKVIKRKIFVITFFNFKIFLPIAPKINFSRQGMIFCDHMWKILYCFEKSGFAHINLISTLSGKDDILLSK